MSKFNAGKFGAPMGGQPPANMAQAMAAHQAGNLAAAEKGYRAVLAASPNHVEALKHLGIVRAQQGDFTSAANWFEQAVVLSPGSVELRAFLANAKRDGGDLAGAAAAYADAIRIQPNDPKLRYSLGHILARMGRAREAADAFGECVRLAPNAVDAWMNRGVALEDCGDLAGAISSHRRAIALDPRSAMAQVNLGAALLASGDETGAAGAFRQARAIDRKRSDEVIESLADARAATGRAKEALVLLQNLDLSEPRIAYKRAGAYQLLRKTDQAIDGFRRLVADHPDMTRAWVNLAALYFDQSRAEEARDAMRHAEPESAKPPTGFTLRRGLLMPVISESREQIARDRAALTDLLADFRARRGVIKDPIEEIGPPAFLLAYHGQDSRDLQQDIAATIAAACPSLTMTSPHLNSLPRRSRIRVGIVSTHFFEHTVGRVNLGIIQGLDRSQMEVVVIRPPGRQDEVSAAIEAAADVLVDLPMDLPSARTVIANEKLDLIFYPDIGMESTTYYLAFARLAPVQVAGWGHPDTTGIPNLDYYVSCATFEPENADSHYTEKLVRLPRIYCDYPDPGPVGAPMTRAELGAPPTGALYICPQSLFKLHPDFDAVIGELLRADPTGHVIFCASPEPHWSERLRARWALNCPDVQGRIHIVPRVDPERFRSMLALADALIDPLYFTGGHTTYLALSANAPIVTWQGSQLRGRMTRGLYEQMGYAGPVASSTSEFVALAVRLAQDKAWHAEQRAEIAGRRGRLFDDHESVKFLGDWFVEVCNA